MRTTNREAHLRRSRVGAVVVCAVVALAGCSSKTKSALSTDAKNVGSEVAGAAGSVVDSAAEVLARNVATQQGEQQFKDAGQELSGPLSCAAKVQDGVTKVDITCAGTTKVGGVAALTGTTDEIPGASAVALTGNFVGTVDGKQVFTTQRLGG